MRTVLQRCTNASVVVDGEVVGNLPRRGLVALVGVSRTDGPDQAETTARKVAELRILDGERLAVDVGAPILAISQFTLLADTAKGLRPSWSQAAPGAAAEPVFDAVVEALRRRGLHVETGRFGVHMEVHLVNDGPVTIVLDV